MQWSALWLRYVPLRCHFLHFEIAVYIAAPKLLGCQKGKIRRETTEKRQRIALKRKVKQRKTRKNCHGAKTTSFKNWETGGVRISGYSCWDHVCCQKVYTVNFSIAEIYPPLGRYTIKFIHKLGQVTLQWGKKFLLRALLSVRMFNRTVGFFKVTLDPPGRSHWSSEIHF